ncbi:MAG: GNAT family N-acetyltransferase [Deltaproteobacteria bacterium]|nr:GNAT family N-acetyltransferase [Deltaproteobacteria bacterium]
MKAIRDKTASSPAELRALRSTLLLGPRGPADRRSAATLDDRIRALEGRAQWYGTAHDWDASGALSPLPIAVPEDLALRRRAMGLPPIEEQTAELRALAGSPPADLPRYLSERDARAEAEGWRTREVLPIAPTLILAEPGDPVFRDALELRYAVLRAPLGVARKDFQPDALESAIYVCALVDSRVVGTVALDLSGGDGVGRLRQMAVLPDLQGSGIGRVLVRTLEREARRHDVTRVWMNARAHVIGFYARLGYAVTSDLFDEVAIPHVRMERAITARGRS